MKLCSVLCTLCLPASAIAYDYDAACDLSLVYGNLKKHVSQKEWMDLRSGKGKIQSSKWLGNYRVYEQQGLSISYTNYDEVTPWNIVYSAKRLPKAMQSKSQILEIVKATPEEVSADNLVVGCDCNETTFTFEGDTLISMRINYVECQ